MQYQTTRLSRPAFAHLMGLSLALFIGLTGCSNNEAQSSNSASASASQSSPASQAAAATEKSAEKSDLSDKLQDYIACYNQLDERAHSSIQRYQSWIKDMDKGPSGKETLVYGLYQLNQDGVQDCQARIQQAAKASPKHQRLDGAALAYADSLSELAKLVNEAEAYYNRENYKDDGFALGKKMHAPLAAAMQKFSQASEEFSEQIEVENDKVLDAELIKLEQTEGRQLPYLQMALMSKAKHLMREIDNQSFDATSAAKKLAEYESLTDEALNYAKTHKESLPSSWSFFASKTEDYRKAAKERIRRVRDKQVYSEGEKMMLKPGSAWMVEGSQEKVSRAYNELIESSNRMNH